jgi:hypothetical protein
VDQDYLLHPRNTEHFNQVIKNLHLACFWYSSPSMDAEGCLSRTRHALDHNTSLDEFSRSQLEEAARHLEEALRTPGWTEWMSHAYSVPLETGGSALSSMLRQAWSDSMETDPNLIDAWSLSKLREANEKGRTEQELHILGWDSREWKCLDFQQEMERIGVAEIREEWRREKAKKKVKTEKEPTVNEGAAQQPPRAPKFIAHKVTSSSPKKKGKGKKGQEEEELERQLAEAEENARRVERQNDTRPRPLADMIETTSRSSKVNFVIETIREADGEDKFVIFGDQYELRLLKEVLNLFDITSCVLLFLSAVGMFNKPQVLRRSRRFSNAASSGVEAVQGSKHQSLPS